MDRESRRPAHSELVDLSAPLTIPEVARLMGWFMAGSKRPNTLLARRRLLHLHNESGGTLLVANGRHYLVRSAERLRAYWPDFARKTAPERTLAQLERELREERRLRMRMQRRTRQLETHANLVTEAIAQMSHDVLAWIEAGNKIPTLPPPEPEETDDETDEPQAAAWDEMTLAAARRDARA